jgi:serine/threonine protein kinase
MTECDSLAGNHYPSKLLLRTLKIMSATGRSMADSEDRPDAPGGDRRRSRERLVAGRYRLVRELGRGGMGVVWLADDTYLDREVALKELRPPPGLTDADREMFRVRAQQEARSAARVRHPNAVTLYDVLSDIGDGAVYLIMELIRGPTLAELVRRSGPLRAPRAAGIGLQLLDVLEAAHGLGVVHRDVKPANILIAANDQVKLADFGIAHTIGDPRLTRSGVLGTPAYQAPELFESVSITPAVDLWSLGATVYYAVDGRGPFDRDSAGATLRAIVLDDLPVPHCEPHLAAFITHTLQRDPAKRATIGQARAELHRVPAQEPSLTPDPRQPRPITTQLADTSSADQQAWWNPEAETRRRPQEPTPPDTAPQGLRIPVPHRRRVSRTAIVIAAVVAASAGATLGLLATVGGPGSLTSIHRARPTITSASARSPLSEDAAGQLVAFVNSSEQVVAGEYYSSGWHGPAVLPGTPRTGSPIVVSPDGSEVFFVAANGDVVHDYASGSGWAGPGRTGGAAGTGSSLAFFPGDGPGTRPLVAFVNARGNLAYDYYASSSSRWHGPVVLPGTPRTGSPVAISPYGANVIFIDSNGEIANDYLSGSRWKGPYELGGTAEAGSGLAFSPGSSTAGTRPAVIFINASGNLAYDYFASGWHGPAVLPGTPRTGSPLAWSGDGTSLYFIEPNGEVATDYVSGSGWQGAYPTGGTAARDSALSYAPGNGTAADSANLMFIASDGTLAYDWYTSRWHGPDPVLSTPR